MIHHCFLHIILEVSINGRVELYAVVILRCIVIRHWRSRWNVRICNVCYLIAEDADIPEIPSFGTLDIDLIAQSDFCFA